MGVKMKVSILTQPLGHNYGGLLQAYALQLYLKSIGCDVETLDRRAPEMSGTIVKNYLINLVRLALGRIKYLPTARKYNHIYRNLSDFRDGNIMMSRKITSDEQLREYYRQHAFDVVLVGSDQVWRSKYSPNLYNYYLDFLDDINSNAKRVSYAASFGVSKWEYTDETTRACKLLISKFSAVSVRERSAIDLCQAHFDITPEWVVDPTMLLKADDYEKLLPPENFSGHEGQILSYVLDPTNDKQQISKKVSNILGKKVFSVKPDKNLTQVQRSELDQCQYPKVETWLQGFKDAHFVVTDSFHGCVFAILFNKPFLAVGNPTRGLARFNSLLSLFNLYDRLIYTAEELSRSIIEASLDWGQVNSIREEKAKAGKAFLQRNIF
ncbi:MAG TPA: polysaccharide pyruvyl transferase family protein [Mariniphaga anaerophila]|uniref:Polysaccharide pyruvyl transferase family protein n=1 Tax=Mariniphaga anaerophila TaxID=1484053 RepID=A0A831LX15_9BACT|nr:polysaccharide pyruvyl transferase family protein [Mariniphaga anaerophila]